MKIFEGLFPQQIKALLLFFSLLVTSELFAQPGSLDPSFGVEGRVSTGFGRSEVYGYAAAVQPDGKIVCGGSAYTGNTTRDFQRDSFKAVLYRYNPDGSRDVTFGNNGVVMSNVEAAGNDNAIYTGIYFIKILDDGRILTYGYRGVDTQYGNLYLTMHLANGSLDNSFGNNGIVEGNFSPNSVGTPLIIQEDNKIVVFGGVYQSSTNANQNFATWAMQRFNADGSLDTTYGTDGMVLTTFGTQLNYPSSLALQEDGKVIASGHSGNGRLLLARYTNTGALDPTFDGDGKVITQFGNANNSVHVRVLPNGKIQSAGSTYTAAGIHFALTQYNANGSLDLTFDGDGRTLSLFETGDISSFIQSATPQSDGKFIVSTVSVDGMSTLGVHDSVTRRYNADGSVDVSFGTNGKATTSVVPGGYSISRRSISIADSKIIAVGNSGISDFTLLQYTSNGTLDTSFNQDGIATEKLESSNDNGRILLKQDDGKLILIGTKRNNPNNVTGLSDLALARYHADGTLDFTFGTEGKSEFVFDQLIYTPKKAALQPDGKILIANEVTIFGVSSSQEMIRVTENGLLDMTFGVQGKIVVSTTFFTPAMALEVLDDGSFIVVNHNINPGGNPDNLYLIVRKFLSNGALDISFGNNGITYLEGIFTSAPDPDIVVQDDGKILIATTRQDPETFYQGFSVFRLNQDGSIDNTFNNDILTIDFTTDCHSIYVEPDGKIIAAGRSVAFTGWFSFYHFVTVRYNANGSMDTAYGTDGITRTQFLGPYGWDNRTISSVVRQVDGKFLVGLNRYDPSLAFAPYELYDFVVFRFNANGEYDSSFGENGQRSLSLNNKYDELFSMVLQDDHKIVLAGTTDNGITRDFALVRLENCINVSAEASVTLCAGETYTINGETYSEEGIYSTTFQNTNGCDSTVTTTLMILPASNSSQEITLCAGETYTINGETYSEEGIYPSTFQNINGCDSTVTTSIFIDEIQVQILIEEDALTAVNFPTDASLQWVDCENNFSAVEGETSPQFNPLVSGNYAVVVANGECSITSACEAITIVGVNTIEGDKNMSALVFPNPFVSQMELRLTGFSFPCQYSVLNALGQEILGGQITQKFTSFSLPSLQAGVYTLRIADNNGQRIIKQIIKN